MIIDIDVKSIVKWVNGPENTLNYCPNPEAGRKDHGLITKKVTLEEMKEEYPVYTEKELREDCDRFMNTINKPQETKVD